MNCAQCERQSWGWWLLLLATNTRIDLNVYDRAFECGEIVRCYSGTEPVFLIQTSERQSLWKTPLKTESGILFILCPTSTYKNTQASILHPTFKTRAFLVAQMVKHPPAMWETWVWSLGQKDPLEKEMATHSSTLA